MGQSLVGLEEVVPNLELSIFLMTLDVNLLISLMGVKFTDFGVAFLILSAESNINEGFLHIGVAFGAPDFDDDFVEETADFVVDDFEETVFLFS